MQVLSGTGILEAGTTFQLNVVLTHRLELLVWFVGFSVNDKVESVGHYSINIQLHLTTTFKIS